MKETKAPKKKGPIRFEAIIPVFILCLITFLYFSYYFDLHLKKLVEYVGTQGNGAEVNVGSIRTSFIKGSFDLDKLQITDPEKPTHNSLEIENIHFQYLWDALLRMKFVVEDASINNIQLLKPRTSPGRVLPPEPAKPSKIDALQLEVMNQVKSKYSENVLGDLVTLLQGGDYQEQLNTIRGTLKSEARVNAMIADVEAKKTYWDAKVKELSDTSKLKLIETQVQEISKSKNVIEQAQGVKKLTDLLKEVDAQRKAIQTESQKLKTEVAAVANYPKELQGLVTEDISSLKDRFSIPKIDFKDMAMHLFAGEFAQYIAKARKYQALAKQYMPEKKEKEEVIPPKRSEGRSYTFPITKGYPFFWLKRAGISSSGTKDSYAGNVAGQLTNVSTAPKQIGQPIILDLQGDFPAAKMMGVKAMFTVDHTKAVGSQSALLEVKSFAVPEKLFVADEKMKFGFLNAVGSTSLSASLQEEKISMKWVSALTKPQFVVESKSKIAQEIISNVVNQIPVVNINGSASGTFKNLNLSVTSNLGDELGKGFSREIGLKVTEAQNKLTAMVDEKINQPKEKLMAQINGNAKNLSSLEGIEDLYKKNEERIQAEIVKLKSGGSGKAVDDLKEKGKKLFKGIKF